MNNDATELALEALPTYYGATGEPMVKLSEVRQTLQRQRAPDCWNLVPWEPAEEQWGGLARALMMWIDLNQRPTGKLLYEHLSLTGEAVPKWLREEIPDTDVVPPQRHASDRDL